MKEKTLLKIALITSIIGVMILYLISDNIEISESEIDKINKGNVGEIIKINGKIDNVVDMESVLFLKISQPAKIDVIAFKEKNISVEQGDSVEIIGKIEEYNGKLEIIAQRIRIIG